MKRYWWWFIILAWLFPRYAEGSPIIASHNGCITSAPTEGVTFTSLDTRSGFQMMAFHAATANCDPTIETPSSGWFYITLTPTSFTVTALTPSLIPTCGRIQFDAHSYAAAGLDPLGLYSLVFNTGIDCKPPSDLLTSQEGLRVRIDTHDCIGECGIIIVPPPCTSNCNPPPPPPPCLSECGPHQVPEMPPTVWLLMLGMGCIIIRERLQLR